jgi:protein ImuA
VRILRDRIQAGHDEPFHLVKGRVHEVEGRGRNGFALFQTTRLPGPVFWIVLAHDRDRPMPAALPDGIAERLLFIEAKGETDLLWTVEEALRSRPVSLVIAAPEKPISLTAGRRLQLAAEAGGTTGLILIQEGKGSNAAETRWKCDPLPSPLDSTRHRWILSKNKKGTIGSYDVSWNGATAAVHLVPQAGERHQPEGPPR